MEDDDTHAEMVDYGTDFSDDVDPNFVRVYCSSGPGRTPALSPPAGRLALRVGGQEGTACLDRAARHVSLLVLEPCPRGTTTCPGVGGGSWRRRALPAAAPPGRSWVATAAARWR